MDRRTLLTTGALALAGSTAQGVPAQAQAGPKSVFPISVSTIPIVGETDVFPVRRIYCITKGAISLAVNGITKQSSDLQNMIWSVAEQISRLSEAFELKAGDIIYSGTPESVGPVVKGDVILCKLEGLPDMSIRIT